MDLIVKPEDPSISELRVPISGNICRGIASSANGIVIPWYRNQQGRSKAEITFTAPSGTMLSPELVHCSIPLNLDSKIQGRRNVILSTLTLPDGSDFKDELVGVLTIATSSNSLSRQVPVFVVPVQN